MVKASVYSIREHAAGAMIPAKEAREIIRMWMDSLSNDAKHESEVLRVGMLMEYIGTVISRLELAVKED